MTEMIGHPRKSRQLVFWKGQIPCHKLLNDLIPPMEPLVALFPLRKVVQSPGPEEDADGVCIMRLLNRRIPFAPLTAATLPHQLLSAASQDAPRQLDLLESPCSHFQGSFLKDPLVSSVIRYYCYARSRTTGGQLQFVPHRTAPTSSVRRRCCCNCDC